MMIASSSLRLFTLEISTSLHLQKKNHLNGRPGRLSNKHLPQIRPPIISEHGASPLDVFYEASPVSLILRRLAPLALLMLRCCRLRVSRAKGDELLDAMVHSTQLESPMVCAWFRGWIAALSIEKELSGWSKA